jgi:ribose 5-phosphate isomerase A
MDSPIEKSKKAAGYAAAELVKENMKIGIGTGSTAFYFIEKLGERCRQGLRIEAAATSQKSWDLALKAGIPLGNIENYTSLDLDIDGADEIDPQKRMIKGGGGALLREKIIASMSKEMIVIVNRQKLVNQLGAFPLPVEIIPFAWKATIHHIENQGFNGTIRQTKEGVRYLTDNGNLIYDIRLSPGAQPEEIDRMLRKIPGVVETGFFIGLAGRVIIGNQDGTVEIRT